MLRGGKKSLICPLLAIYKTVVSNAKTTMNKIKLLWNKFCTFVKYKIMNRKSSNSNKRISPVDYMERKKFIRDYLDGKKTRSELNERGIKLKMPV